MAALFFLAPAAFAAVRCTELATNPGNGLLGAPGVKSVNSQIVAANATAPAEESATLTLVPPLPLTTCDSGALFEPALLASPPYIATMLCVPTVRLLVEHTALGVLPPPLSATALQPAIDDPPSLKSTVPVGAAVPKTVAVRSTLAPDVDGFNELPSVVVVGGSPEPTQEGNLNDPIRVCQLPLLPFVWLL